MSISSLLKPCLIASPDLQHTWHEDDDCHKLNSTHWCRVTRMCVINKQGYHWFRWRLVSSDQRLMEVGFKTQRFIRRKCIRKRRLQMVGPFAAKPLSKPCNAGLLSIVPLGTNFSLILFKIQKFSFTKMHLNISSAKWRSFCPGGDELICISMNLVCQCWL